MPDLQIIDGASYLPLEAFAPLPRPTRFHDDPGIARSLGRFGMIDTPTINTITGHTLGGWGRVTALRVMARAGAGPPAQVITDGDTWLVPVYPVSVPAEQEEAAALALNKLVENGGYDEITLLAVLEDIRERPAVLDAAGYHADEVDFLARLLRAAPPDRVPKEKPPETHKHFAVGSHRWEVAIEAYAAWEAALREQALAAYQKEHGPLGEDEPPPDLDPLVTDILYARLGFADDLLEAD